jgi:hypothetical protein
MWMRSVTSQNDIEDRFQTVAAMNTVALTNYRTIVSQFQAAPLACWALQDDRPSGNMLHRLNTRYRAM